MMGVTVIGLISHDTERLFDSLESYYDYVDEIIFGVEEKNVSMSMNPIIIPSIFFEKIRNYPKVRLAIDSFYSRARTPMENDTYQRNILSTLAKKDNWIVQIDSDEVILNPKEFFSWLRKQPQSNHLIMGWSVFLFKEVNGRYMVPCRSDMRNFSFGYFPVATILRNNFIAARRTRQMEKSSPLIVLHYSWARSCEGLRQKLKNWSHSEDFDTEAFFKKWDELNAENYTQPQYRKFHPLKGCWWHGFVYKSKEEILKEVSKQLRVNRFRRRLFGPVKNLIERIQIAKVS